MDQSKWLITIKKEKKIGKEKVELGIYKHISILPNIHTPIVQDS
jgi:hypothetical protein